MNPALIAPAVEATSNAIKSGEVTKLVVEARKPAKYFAIGLIVVAVLVVAYFAYKAWKKKRDSALFNNVDIIPNATSKSQVEKNKTAYANTFANQLKSAFNPSGNDWMIDFDTTNTNAVLEVATKMKTNGVSFAQVASAYFLGYKDDLAKRLQKELDSKDLKDFYSRAGINTIYGLTGQFVRTF
jgi:hypothetical protein